MMKYLALLTLISTSAFAEYQEIKGIAAKIIVRRLAKDTLEYIQAHKNPDCTMSDTHGLSVLVDRGGVRTSEEMTFNPSSDSGLESRVYFDKEASRILIEQSFPDMLNANLLYVTYSQDSVTDVTVVVEDDPKEQHTISCN